MCVCVLAQPSCGFVHVGLLSLWRGAFRSGSRNPLGTLCVLDRSRCGALRILISFVQPSPNFVHVGSLSLRRGANFDIARATFLALCAGRIALVVARWEF